MRIAAAFLWVLFISPVLNADENRFRAYEMGFKNFITCELTRTNATDHFKGKPFKITMIDLFDVRQESGIAILTGAVQCAVGKRYHTLYVAVGVEKVVGQEQVNYYLIRPDSFTILATDLIRYPYKERCPWARYWIQTD